jgi:hypothetical protein
VLLVEVLQKEEIDRWGSMVQVVELTEEKGPVLLAVE